MSNPVWLEVALSTHQPASLIELMDSRSSEILYLKKLSGRIIKEDIQCQPLASTCGCTRACAHTHTKGGEIHYTDKHV